MASTPLNIELNLQGEGYTKGINSAIKTLKELGKENGVTGVQMHNMGREVNSAKRYFATLTAEYAKLSDEAKKTEFGKAMHQQLQQTEQDLMELMEVTEQTNQKLKEMQETAKQKVGGGFSMKQMGKDIMGKMGMGQLAEAGSLKAAAGVAGMAAGVGLAITAYQGLSAAISNNIETAREFEKSCSSIQALTGANAETMNKLKQSAIELGGSTTQSATQVMQAFGMIGSQAPQLLEDAEALSKVTEYSIMLSEAAGIELSDAAAGVTGILNQFGLSANKAKDVVNLLAAASQKGAGNVAYLNSAITKCGSVAGALGVSTNQTVAVIEQLAQAGIDASSAGNNLKNIMLKLEASSDKNLKPSVVGLVKALQNLRDKQLSSTKMSKMFGSENVAAALTLVRTADAADKLTASITGTNTAEEQQKINNDNLDGSLKNLESKWEAFNLAVNQGNGLIRLCVDATAVLVGWMTKLITKTDAATEARKRFNKEMSGGKDTDNGKDGVGTQVNAVKDQDTKGKMIGQHNKTMATYRKIVGDYNKELEKVEKEIEAGQIAVGTGIDNMENAAHGIMLANLEKKREELKKEREETIKAWKEFNKLSLAEINQGPLKNREKSNPNTGGTGGDGGDDADKTKLTAAQKYANTLAQISQQELLMLYDEENTANNEKKAIEARISAINSYIDELTKDEAAIKKNKSKVNELIAEQNKYKNKLKQVKKSVEDYTIVKNANQEYADTIDKLDRDRKNEWITEEEYNDQYIDAIKTLINKYKSVTNVTEELKEAMNTAKGNLKGAEGNKKQEEYTKAYEAYKINESLVKERLNDISLGKTPNKSYESQRERYYTMQNIGKQFASSTLNGTVSKDRINQWVKTNKETLEQLGLQMTKMVSTTANRTEEEWKKLYEERKQQPALGDKDTFQKMSFEDFKTVETIAGTKEIEKSVEEITKDLMKIAALEIWTRTDKSATGLKLVNSYLKSIGEETLKDAKAADEYFTKLQQGEKWAHPEAQMADWRKNGQPSTFGQANVKVNDNGEVKKYLKKVQNIVNGTSLEMTIGLSEDDAAEIQAEADEIQNKVQKTFDKTKVKIDFEADPEAIEHFKDAIFEALKGLDLPDELLKSLESKISKVTNKTVKKTSTPKYKGNESNYKMNATPNDVLTKEVTIYTPQDSITSWQNKIDRLLERHKAKQDVVLELQNNVEELQKKFPEANIKAKLDIDNKELNQLENEIISLGKRLRKALTIETRINAGIDGLSQLQSLVNYTQGLASFKKQWDAISKDEDSSDFEKGLQKTNMIISQIISTMQVYNTVLQLCTSLQTVFGMATTTAAAADAAATATIVGDSLAKTSAESGEAIAGATAAGAKLPFPFNIAAIAAGVAAVIAAITMISSFAEGGVVTGGGFSGDSALVRANRGEMILNNRQQKNLFDVLDGRGGMLSSGGEVEFHLKGTELIGLIKNTNAKKSRIR